MPLASHTIVGFGAVGQALTHSLHATGERVSSVVTGRKNEVEQELKSMPDCLVSDQIQIPVTPFPHLIWLTVPDDNIAETLSDVLNSDQIKMKDDLTILHCSGSLGLDTLSDAKHLGYSVASLHPLQTFSKEAGGEDNNSFRDVYASILSSDETTEKRLDALCDLLGILPMHVSEQEKKQIHLSAAIACNYLTTLLDIARRQLPEGKSISIEIFEPLLKKTIEQNLRLRPEQALSGPVKRGDYSTIITHLELLKNDDVNIYKALGSKTLRLVNELNTGHQNIQELFDRRE